MYRVIICMHKDPWYMLKLPWGYLTFLMVMCIHSGSKSLKQWMYFGSPSLFSEQRPLWLHFHTKGTERKPTTCQERAQKGGGGWVWMELFLRQRGGGLLSQWAGLGGSYFSAHGGRGWTHFLGYTKIHKCASGHKTAELWLTRWVLSVCAWRRILPNTSTSTSTLPASTGLPLRRFFGDFHPWGPACLIFRHVQIAGFTDSPATCSNALRFAIPCKMSTRRWP